jgi:hypothetical protein
MTVLAGGRVRIPLPPGWEGVLDPGGELPDGARRWLVAHLANFPLPTERGTFGLGVVNLMHPGDAFVVLFEYGPESVGTPLFADAGVPRKVEAAEFSRDILQHPLPGQSGTQRFFVEAGRPFMLYVVVGSHIDRADVLPEINRVLADLEIEP